MRITAFVFCLGLFGSAAAAQQPLKHTAVIDFTVGSHKVSGQTMDMNPGGFVDLFFAGTAHSTERWGLVVGGGLGGVVGGFGDRCLITPDGCAPKANFGTFNALVGGEIPLGSASARALIGPALYSGDDDKKLGAMLRIDLLSPALVHMGLGAMFRTTVIPSYGGRRMVASALGVSLIAR